MLVNFNVLFMGWGALKVVGVIAVVAIGTKYIAAWITQKSFRLSADEGKMIFGLSTSRAAATLAIVLVGYNIIIGETPGGEPVRLLNEDILNGTILLILISCAISSIVVEKAAHNLALKEAEEAGEEENGEKILISLSSPETVEELIDFGLMLKPKKNNIPVYALNIISDDSNNETTQFKGKKMMDKAVKQAAASENTIIPLTRFDMNKSNGIIYTIKEQNITDVLIGINNNPNQKDFPGPVTESVIRKSGETIFLYEAHQPFNTLKRMMVTIPPYAELEPGFQHWLSRLGTIAKAGGLPIYFFANELTIKELKRINEQSEIPAEVSYKFLSDWEDFLIMSGELKANDFFVIVFSRKGYISYDETLEKIPYYLLKYFNQYSYLILYPKQLPEDNLQPDEQDHFLLDALADKVQVVNKAGNFISRIFKRKNE